MSAEKIREKRQRIRSDGLMDCDIHFLIDGKERISYLDEGVQRFCSR